MKQQNQVNKLKTKFKFLGKLMAKAVMDFRVLDLPLSPTFYKLVIDKASVCEDDLKYVDAQLYTSIQSLRDYVRLRRQILLDMAKGVPGAEDKLAELEKVHHNVAPDSRWIF